MYPKSPLFMFFATILGIAFISATSQIASFAIFILLVYSCSSYFNHGHTAADYNNWFNRCYSRYIEEITGIATDIIFSLDLQDIIRKTIIYFIWYTTVFKNIRNYFKQGNENCKNDEVQENQYCGVLPSIASEFNVINDCILRDFIKPWYHQNISKNEDFVNDVGNIIQITFLNLSRRLKEIDSTRLFVEIMNIYQHHIYHFKNAVYSVDENSHHILDVCLHRKYDLVNNTEIMIHWALSEDVTESCYIRSIASILIKMFGPPETQSCPALKILLTDVLDHNVIGSLVNMLADPNRLNIWMLKLCQKLFGIKYQRPEQKEPHTEDIQGQVSTDDTVTSYPQIELEHESVEPESSFSRDFNFASDNTKDVKSAEISSDPLSQIPSTSGHDRGDTSESLSVRDKIFSRNNALNKSSSSCHVIECTSGGGDDQSLWQAEVQMKRSRSEDYISHMKQLCNTIRIPFRTGTLKYEGTQKSYELPDKSQLTSASNVSIYEPTVGEEVPDLFLDIKITDALLLAELGRNPYVLYCVEYNGLFQDASSNESNPVLVRETVQIKRRFREFYALHSRLESCPLVKNLIKGIKGPSKKLTPFAYLDERNIAARRDELETYLQELCKHTMITRTPEFQEFLAYGSDASIAFVEKLKFSQVIEESFKYAKDMVVGTMFRIAKPVLRPVYQISQKIISDISSSREEPKQADYVLEHTKQASEKFSDIMNFCQTFSGSPDEILCPTADIIYHTRPSSQPSVTPVKLDVRDCGCKQEIYPFDDALRNQHYLAHAFLDMVHEILSGPLEKPSRTANIFQLIPTLEIEEIIERKLEELDEQWCVSMLHSLHKSMWPEQKQPSAPIDEDIPIFLCNYLRDNIFGLRNFSDIVELMIGSLQNDKLNKCLLYSIFDEVIGVLCDENRYT